MLSAEETPQGHGGNAMTKREEIESLVEEQWLEASDTVLVDGCDDAILGTVERFCNGGHVTLVAYDADHCGASGRVALVRNQGLGRDALESIVAGGGLSAETLFADGYDAAIAGTAECREAGYGPVVLYDYDRYIELLVAEGMSWEEASEYFDFNVSGAYVGEGTPAFLNRLEG